jgi:hypothetical protein
VVITNNLFSPNIAWDHTETAPNISFVAGNRTIESGDLLSDYRPSASGLAKWKGQNESVSGDLLSEALRAMGLSLLPTRQLNSLNVRGTIERSAPITIPGAME